MPSSPPPTRTWSQATAQTSRPLALRLRQDINYCILFLTSGTVSKFNDHQSKHNFYIYHRGNWWWIEVAPHIRKINTGDVFFLIFKVQNIQTDVSQSVYLQQMFQVLKRHVLVFHLFLNSLCLRVVVILEQKIRFCTYIFRLAKFWNWSNALIKYT
jgi:hypothetical protein